MVTKSSPSAESDSTSSKIPHFHGHRARLRTKFDQAQGKGLADYELLELLLFLARPTRGCETSRKSSPSKIWFHRCSF